MCVEARGQHHVSSSSTLFETGLIISLELPDQVIRPAGGKFHRPSSLFLPLWGQDYRCAPRYPVFMWVPRPELRSLACAASTLPAESSPQLLAMNSNSVQHKGFVLGGRHCRRNSERGLCQLITVAFPVDLDMHNLCSALMNQIRLHFHPYIPHLWLLLPFLDGFVRFLKPSNGANFSKILSSFLLFLSDSKSK